MPIVLLEVSLNVNKNVVAELELSAQFPSPNVESAPLALLNEELPPVLPPDQTPEIAEHPTEWALSTAKILNKNDVAKMRALIHRLNVDIRLQLKNNDN